MDNWKICQVSTYEIDSEVDRSVINSSSNAIGHNSCRNTATNRIMLSHCKDNFTIEVIICDQPFLRKLHTKELYLTYQHFCYILELWQKNWNKTLVDLTLWKIENCLKIVCRKEVESLQAMESDNKRHQSNLKIHH